MLFFGEIVLLKFPFTEGKSFKKRPGLILRDCNDGDVIVCRITSKIYRSVYDVKIANWKDSGLLLPSVIRVHKLATLEMELVDRVMGEIDEVTKDKVRKIIERLPG
jgi:mRNA interferase MazF